MDKSCLVCLNDNISELVIIVNGTREMIGDPELDLMDDERREEKIDNYQSYIDYALGKIASIEEDVHAIELRNAERGLSPSGVRGTYCEEHRYGKKDGRRKQKHVDTTRNTRSGGVRAPSLAGG